MEEIKKDKGEAVIINCNTTKEKLEAILNLSKAVMFLSKALISTSTSINVANCTFQNTDIGIKVTE